MCGIAGILNITNSTRHTDAIRVMTNRIAHRGPDAEGVFVDEHIALGHRRLSIIDLHESSNQPMWDFSGRYVIVYNGEIYNYKEVRAQLAGYSFKTQSDTEVIMAAYATWGVKCLEKFNGMFAFAIWDTKAQALFVARDRLGKKPLYYYHDIAHFIFSSEVRSMLASGLFDRQLEDTFLSEYFVYQAAMNEHTMVRGIKRLEAGHYALIKDGQFTAVPYWSFEQVERCDDDFKTAKQKVKDHMLDAVRMRMVSDVPIGAFLSGGIDSSLIVACMAEQSASPVNTFTVSFAEKQFDESGFAQQIATMYKTNHHRLLIKPDEFLYSIEDILAAMDTPSGDGPNTYLVAKHTRAAGIKVAMSGLGGDELFAGYNKFLMYHRVMKHTWFTQLPLGLRKALAKTMVSLAPHHKYAKLADLAGLKKWDLASVYPLLRRAYSNSEINRLLAKPNKIDGVEEKLATLQPSINWMGDFSKCTIGELESYTRDVLLRDTDQMSMAHALEVRVPFFDYRLVEYVLSLSDAIKYPHTPKHLLVEAMSPRLPKAISQRSKMGFTLPMKHWLRNELASMAGEKIAYLADRREFNHDEVMHKWKSFKKGDDRILWTRIWKLVVLSDWLQRNNL